MLRKISLILVWLGIAFTCVGALGLAVPVIAQAFATVVAALTNTAQENLAVGALLALLIGAGILLAIIGGAIYAIADALKRDKQTRSWLFLPITLLLAGTVIGLQGVSLLVGITPLPDFHKSNAGSGDPQGSMYDGIGIMLIQLPLAVVLVLFGLFLLFLRKRKAVTGR